MDTIDTNNTHLEKSVNYTEYDGLNRIRLFGFNFISLNSYEPLLNQILKNEFKGLPYLITPNLFQLVTYEENFELKNEFEKSSYIMPDGQPIVIASRILRKPLQRRLPGSDFFYYFWAEIIKKDIKVYMISPNKETAKKLKLEHNHLDYFVPPIFDLEDKEVMNTITTKICEDVINRNPSYIIIGLGFPKQEILALNLRKRLEASNFKCPLILLLGASMEFYTQHKKRAPSWVQKIGMEWFHRFLTEPVRLFKRYFIDSFKFIPMFYKELGKRN